MNSTRLLTSIQYYLELLRTNYWFIPCLMLAGSIVMAYFMLRFDEYQWLAVPDWLALDTPSGARDILSTIAGAIITIAGVTFSITIVALTLTSQQFGPRTLRNFLADRGNQITLGMFISTFVYCIAILGAVRGDTNTFYIPQWSVLMSMFWALLSILVLVYFINHVASSIRGPAIIRALFKESESVLKNLFPADKTYNQQPPEWEEDFSLATYWLHSPIAGYVQAYNINKLISVAAEANLLIKLDFTTGDFVYDKQPIIGIKPAMGITEDLEKEILNCVIIGSIRTPEQDPTHVPECIAELAVRSLSAGINDPYTAIECIDWLTDLLAYIARIELPPEWFRDEAEVVRLHMKRVDFAEFLLKTFTPIRQYGSDSAMIVKKLCDAYMKLSSGIDRPNNHAALLSQLEHLREDAEAQLSPADWRVVDPILMAAMTKQKNLTAE